MGLDIYVYRYTNRAESERLEALYEKESERLWACENPVELALRAGASSSSGGVAVQDEELSVSVVEADRVEAKRRNSQSSILSSREKAAVTPEDIRINRLRSAACKRVASDLGLGAYGSDETHKTKIEIASAKYPDHLFQVGYFRSSYNGSGINRVLDAHLGIDLNDLLPSVDGGDEDYVRRIDWAQAKRLTEGALEQLRAKLQAFPYRATEIDAYNPFSGPAAVKAKDEASALDLFRPELDRFTARPEKERGPHAFGGSYSNSTGHFWLDEALEVVGAIPGKDSLGTPCVYLVYKYRHGDSYLQSLEIIIETCDYVLGQPDPENYLVHWSG